MSRMPTTIILGGSGKVARHLTKQLSANEKHTVFSIIRNPAQVDELKALGTTPIVQSIEDSTSSELASTFKKHNPDFVVWSAGAGGGNPERTVNVDNKGAIKSFDACAEAGVKRFIMVSALDIRDKENKPAPSWYGEDDFKRSDRIWGVIGPYMKAKLTADTNLRTQNSRRGLDYTIVRPGGLSQDPGVGKVAAGKVSSANMVSREDVAAVIVQCMKNSGTIGLAFDVAGGDTPIADAVGKVASEKVDTFEGFY